FMNRFLPRVAVLAMLLPVTVACSAAAQGAAGATSQRTARSGTGDAISAPPAVSAESVLATGLAIAQAYRVEAIQRRRFTHREFWDAVAPSLRSPALRTEEIGRSIQGRAIRAVTFGSGPTPVLLWSQMHGDEVTATMA